MVKSAQPMILLLDSVLNSQKEKKSIEASRILPLIAHAVTFLGYTSYLTSIKRREFLKPDIAQDYQSVCSKSNPVTTCLFGDEMPKQIKEIGEINKIAKRTMFRSTVSSKRNSDYKSNNSSSRYTQRGGRRAPLGYRSRVTFSERSPSTNQSSPRTKMYRDSKDKA